MKIAGIVAMTPSRLIGKSEGGLPWHLPEDLQLFKSITMGHPVVMGRKTYDTRKSALPGRHNIVLTKDHSWWVDDATVINSPTDLVKVIDLYEKIFIIGGSEIFSLFLPHIEELHVSTVFVDVEERPEDIYFPEFYDEFDCYHHIDNYNGFTYGIYKKDEGGGKLAPLTNFPIKSDRASLKLSPKIQRKQEEKQAILV